jgi:hypothetical protein
MMTLPKMNLKNKSRSENKASFCSSFQVTVGLSNVGSTKSVFKALRGLAKLLEIEAPRQWLQEDRASKRAVFRVKRDGGRDGPPLDLQSILNRAAKVGLEKTRVF